MLSLRDLSLGLFVIVVWAANAIAIKFITNEIEPLTGLTFRLVLATISFAPFLYWPGKKMFMHIFQATMLINVLHFGSLIWAISLLDASMAAILLQMQVIFSVIWGMIFFNEKCGWRTYAGMGLGILGVIILVGMPENTPSMLGVAGMVFTTMMISLGYARIKTLPEIRPISYMAFTHALALPPIAAATFLFENPMDYDWPSVNWITVGINILFQVYLVSVAHMVWQRLISRNKMSVLPNLTLLIPFLGVGFAVVLLGEPITWAMVAGGLITTAGVGIVMARKSHKTDPPLHIED